MLDKNNPNYREIKVLIKVTPAEATIAWFYSGRKQELITNEIRFPVHADGEYDCTEALQKAVNSGYVYLPAGNFTVQREINITGKQEGV
jgi:hypothetical protein